MEDLKTGVSITDLGLNDFRMDLLNYVKTNNDLTSMPNGMHAVIPADPEKVLFPGVIFYSAQSKSWREYQSAKPVASLLSDIHRRMKAKSSSPY